VILASKNRPLFLLLISAPFLFASIAALQARIDQRTRSAAQAQEELLLTSGPAVKRLSLGYDSLLADIYWTRAVQYYGEHLEGSDGRFDLLWPLLDISTTLDPKLIPAYRFGAIFLSETGEMGAGRPDLAIALVKRGIAANPDDWHLDSDLGLLYYWRLKDYPDAQAAYVAGGRVPQAPPWLNIMAARIAEKGGSIETSRMIWSNLYETSKDKRVRQRALEMMNALKAEEDEMHLDELAEQYRKRFGHYPASSREMRDAGMLAGIPVDPAGYAYIFGPDGKSRLSPDSPILTESQPTNPSGGSR